MDEKDLEQVINKLLADQSDKAYERLLMTMQKKENELILRKSSSLGIVREMAEKWKKECEWGQSKIFHNIYCVEDAEMVYTSIKHGLWRLEHNLSLEKCLPFVEKMCDKEQSKYLIVWIAYANLKYPAKVLTELGTLMMEYDMVSALEVLSYGIMYFPKDTDLVLLKVECLIEMQLWKDALDTLLLLEEPEAEIQEIISELKNVVGSV